MSQGGKIEIGSACALGVGLRISASNLCILRCTAVRASRRSSRFGETCYGPSSSFIWRWQSNWFRMCLMPVLPTRCKYGIRSSEMFRATLYLPTFRDSSDL